MCLGSRLKPVRIRHRSHHFATQCSHFVDRAGWQAKMASIEFCILYGIMRMVPIALAVAKLKKATACATAPGSALQEV